MNRNQGVQVDVEVNKEIPFKQLGNYMGVEVQSFYNSKNKRNKMTQTLRQMLDDVDKYYDTVSNPTPPQTPPKPQINTLRNTVGIEIPIYPDYGLPDAEPVADEEEENVPDLISPWHDAFFAPSNATFGWLNTSPQISVHSSPPISIHSSPPISIQSSPSISSHPSPPISIHPSPPISIHSSPHISVPSSPSDVEIPSSPSSMASSRRSIRSR